MTFNARLAPVDILLSSYNGSKFLNEQINSILDQSYKNWRLLVRDDGSSDSSVDIIKSYINKYGRSKILFIEDSLGNLGPMGSFEQLMKCSLARYIMFSDQDDIWLNNKIELSLKKMHDLEQEYGSHMPLLVFGDSMLVDEGLKVIAPSTRAHMKWDWQKSIILRNLAMKNIISGNTVMANRCLCLFVQPIPKEAYMHDWWMGMVAAAFGNIGYVSAPVIKYRQHNLNACGMTKVPLIEVLRNNFKGTYMKYMTDQDRTMLQIKAFCKRYDVEIADYKHKSSGDFYLLSQFAVLDTMKIIDRTLFLFRYYLLFPHRLKAMADLLLYYRLFG